MHKQYYLKKNLPDLKAGAIFTFTLDNSVAKLFSCERYVYTEKFILSNPDWFEEIKEPGLTVKNIIKINTFNKVLKCITILTKNIGRYFINDFIECKNKHGLIPTLFAVVFAIFIYIFSIILAIFLFKLFLFILMLFIML